MKPNLTAARIAAELTQKELGLKVGLSAQTICDIEKGRVVGRADTWEAFASILKVPQKKLRYQPENEKENHDEPVTRHAPRRHPRP